jgi:hypothetical protein
MARTHFQLRIDRLVLDMDGDRATADRARAVIRDALQRLSARLQSSPFARRAPSEAIALERVTLDVLPMNELFGPRGAERLADELYTELTRRIG